VEECDEAAHDSISEGNLRKLQRLTFAGTLLNDDEASDEVAVEG